MHGCNFESDRRRKVGSGSLSAKERYVRIGGRTESNRKQAGGEVVHRLWPGLDVEASAPAAEQLRETYTGVRQTCMPDEFSKLLAAARAAANKSSTDASSALASDSYSEFWRYASSLTTR
jgi:hypothetical protein